MRVPPEPAWSGAPPVSWILRESRMPALLAGQTGQIRQRANWFWPRNRGTLSDSHNIQLTGPAPPHVGHVGTLMYGWKCAPATKEKCGRAHVAAGAATALSCPARASLHEGCLVGYYSHCKCLFSPKLAPPRPSWPHRKPPLCGGRGGALPSARVRGPLRAPRPIAMASVKFSNLGSLRRLQLSPGLHALPGHSLATSFPLD